METKHMHDAPPALGDEKLGCTVEQSISVSRVIAGDYDGQPNSSDGEVVDKEFRFNSAPDDHGNCCSQGDSHKEWKGKIESIELKTECPNLDENVRNETEGMLKDADQIEKIHSSDKDLDKKKEKVSGNGDQKAKFQRSEEEFGKQMDGMLQDVDSMDKFDSVNEGICKTRNHSSDEDDLYENREAKCFEEADRKTKIHNSNEEDTVKKGKISGELEYVDHKVTSQSAEFVDWKAAIQRSNEESAKESKGILDNVDHKSRAQSSGEDLVRKRVSLLLQHAKALQMAGSTLSSRLRVEEENLRQQAILLEKDIDLVKSDVFSALEMGNISVQLAEKLEEEIGRAHWMIYQSDVRLLLSHKFNGKFLRLFLGPVNVKAVGDDVRFKVKEEYNAYRDRTATLFLVFPLVLWLLKTWVWNGCLPAVPVQAYQAWLLFFYTSLALRENILRINGSDIRPWWIYHHYCAMLMAVISLTWDFKGQHPHCEEKQHGVRHFLLWAMMQGVVMLLQNRYQRQRLYTRIALGKAGRMDVVWSETAGNDGQILLFYPLLFALQIFQGFIGFLLLRTALTKRSEWQVSGCGILLLVMALGNFLNTVDTLLVKMRIKSRMKGKLAFAKKSR